VTTPEAIQKRNHIFAVIGGTVLALGLVRAMLLVAHTPPLGYDRPSLAAGVVGLLMIGGVAIFTAWSLRRHPVASIVHALLFFLIVADPVSTLWMTSLAPERYALVGLYAIPAMVAVIGLAGGTRVHWGVLLAGFILLGFGPPRLVLLPLALAAVAFPVLRKWRGEAMTVFVVALVATMVMYFLQPERQAAQEPAIGISLVPANTVGRSESEPVLSPRAMARALPSATSLAPASLYIASEGAVQRLVDLPPRIMSFAGLIAPLPATASTMISMIVIVTLPFAIYWLAWSARRGEPAMVAVPALYVILVTVTAYCAMAAVVGHTGGDDARDQALGALTMLAALLLSPLVIWHLSRDFWAGRIALVVALGVVILGGGWFAWSRTAPLAIGTVERIAQGPNHTLEVSGWAIDPRGVKRVFATVGGGAVTEAALGTERRDLQAAYPGYPDVLTGGFQMSIASNAWRDHQSLRVFVENRTGAITEIDRRDVRLAP
jgi:hypothetical protein